MSRRSDPKERGIWASGWGRELGARMGEYFYYEDDFEPKGPSLFRRFLSLCFFMIKAHAFFMQLIA